MSRSSSPDGLRRAVVGGVVQHQHLALELGWRGALDRVEAGEQELPPVRVDHAVGEQHGENARPCASKSSIRRPTRRRMTTPSRGALARAGAEVELITCRFPYGPVPREQGYEVREFFYRRSSGAGHRRRGAGACCGPWSTCRTCSATARARRGRRRRPLPVAPGSSSRPSPARRQAPARLHDALAPAGARHPRSRGTLPRCWRRWTRSSSHSEHGAGALASDFGVAPAKLIEVIPHGAFDYLTRQQDEVAAARRARARSRGR